MCLPMLGVQGPYAREVFLKELNAPASSLINAIPKNDFNGGHADPVSLLHKSLVIYIFLF